MVGKTTYLDDEGAEVTQDVVDILGCPYAGCRHGLDQVRTSEQGNLGLLGTLRSVERTTGGVDFMLEMVEHLCCLKVVLMESLPGVNCVYRVRKW